MTTLQKRLIKGNEMVRPLRIEYPNACYHIMNRGTAKQNIFFEPSHQEIFLEVLAEICQKHEIITHSYCLMNNHYHLMLSTPRGNISRGMQRLNGIYTQRINALVGRDGPLFRGRFKSILVQSNYYAARLSRYIHLNPVAAKLVMNPAEYPWSSAKYYASDKYTLPKWLDKSLVINSIKSIAGNIAYDTYMAQGTDAETDSFFSTKQSVPIFGDQDFLKHIMQNYLCIDKEDTEMPAVRATYRINRPDISTLVKELTVEHQLNYYDLISRRGNYRHPLRDSIIYYLSMYAGYTNREIANEFGFAAAGSITDCNQRCIKSGELSRRADLLIALRKKFELYKS